MNKWLEGGDTVDSEFRVLFKWENSVALSQTTTSELGGGRDDTDFPCRRGLPRGIV